ncbi:5-(carboxyamino)imidazole ribonucleotide synthase, partial [Microvirga sp. M8]|nr:5-(carboxyamino)imidazole ribonucleotide synthase [Microvirga tunisiensis]
MSEEVTEVQLIRESIIRPGCTLGILGGGQLGRMIAMAAAQLGLRTHIYAPDENSPAFEVATEFTI